MQTIHLNESNRQVAIWKKYVLDNSQINKEYNKNIIDKENQKDKRKQKYLL